MSKGDVHVDCLLCVQILFEVGTSSIYAAYF